jgi:hypothetical protein
MRMPPDAKLRRSDESGGYFGVFKINIRQFDEIVFSQEKGGFSKEKIDGVVLE